MDDQDLPPGWHDAQRMSVLQGSCAGPASTLDRMRLTPAADGSLAISFDTAQLRCGQAACGYALAQGATSKVLVQPCDMHPHRVDKCACITRLDLTLPPDGARRNVELWLRPDHYGHSGPNLPVLADRQLVSPTCLGPNPALACATDAGACVPSACTCTSNGWTCTADCGPGRPCADGGAADAAVP